MFRYLNKILIKTKFWGKDTSNNLEYNRQLWDSYAIQWDKSDTVIENPSIKDEQRDSYINYLGDEWGDTESLLEVLNDFLYPYLSSDLTVMEIGTGGGRVASKSIDKVKELYCIDISKEMLKHLKTVLKDYSNVFYLLIKEPEAIYTINKDFDFIYSFDVMVHVDLHTIWRYLQIIDKKLKPSGKAFLHTTNLLAPGGWERFSKQKIYNPGDHYFIVPEIIDALIKHTNLKIIKRSDIKTSNFYYNRDYLFVLEKQ